MILEKVTECGFRR